MTHYNLLKRIIYEIFQRHIKFIVKSHINLDKYTTIKKNSTFPGFVNNTKLFISKVTQDYQHTHQS